MGNRLKLKRIVNSFLEENTYIIYCNDVALIIDPGSDFKIIDSFLKDKGLTDVSIYLTHSHVDHILSCKKLLIAYNAPLYVYKDEVNLLKDSNLNMSEHHSERLEFDGIALDNELDINGLEKFLVYHVPGHTSGHSMLYSKELQALFTGDFVFYHDIGRCDLPTGSIKDMYQSLSLFKTFDNNILVYPGHGDKSNVGNEKRDNPYLNGTYNNG
jgi:glyoxylase-like metal-dependent hydrolase (beta-lactamase superfamily II)